MQTKDFHSLTYHSGKWESQINHVIGEEAVRLTVNNEPWLTFMCTPDDLEALAVGFLYNEEIITSADEIASMHVCHAESAIDLWMNRSVQKPEHWTRTSGCSGGKTSVARPNGQGLTSQPCNGNLIPAEKIISLVKQLSGAQALYRYTGGVHTSALCDGEKIFLTAEDIGRHNTLDKLAGKCLLEGISLRKRVILTTGRISSEMLQKAGRMEAVMIISRTSPSTRSVEMAEQMGITLVGYARQERFMVYTHPERILTVHVGADSHVRQHDE